MWEANEKHSSVHQQSRLIKYTLLLSASSEGSDGFTTTHMAGTDVDINAEDVSADQAQLQ